MEENINFGHVFPDKEIFSIDKERGVVCFHIEYTNTVVLEWITTPRGKSPGFVSSTQELRQNYPEFSLWCAELIRILTYDIPLVIEMHFKLK